MDGMRSIAIDAVSVNGSADAKRTVAAPDLSRLVVRDPHLPAKQGMYQPGKEHDACGVGFIADLMNRKSHSIVSDGLQILLNLDHRGAVGADPKLADGCGILVQIPHRFFAEECAKLGFHLPDQGHYGVGHFFMPRDPAARAFAEEAVNKAIEDEGQILLGWRDVPVDSSDLGEAVRAVEPVQRQVFIGRGAGVADEEEFERRLFILRKVVSNAIYAKGGQTGDSSHMEYYAVSLSCRTVVYKGMVLVSSLVPITRTCRMSASKAPSRSSISASPPTPSPPGGWPTLPHGRA